MSEYRAYMQNTKLHNGTKRKKRRHRFLFGVLLSALLITGALYGREYDISQLKNIEVMETLSSAVSQFGDRKLPVYSVQTTEKKIALSFDCAWGAEDFDMCNKVAWLDHGHLRRLGPTKEITAEYRKFEKKDAMPAKVTEE